MHGIPTIRVFEALACGIPLLISAPWQDTEAPLPSRAITCSVRIAPRRCSRANRLCAECMMDAAMQSLSLRGGWRRSYSGDTRAGIARSN